MNSNNTQKKINPLVTIVVPVYNVEKFLNTFANKKDGE